MKISEAGELIESFYKILTDKYGENLVDKICLNDYKWEFIIKYPEIIITNSKRITHKILDLYCSFKVLYGYIGEEGDKSGLYLSNKIRCGRGVLNITEYNNNYYHSHYPTIRDDDSYFCLGYSEMGSFISETCISGLNEDTFEFFTYLLDSYLAWESLEGGPYIKIAGLKEDSNKGTWNNSFEIEEDVVYEIIKQCLKKDIIYFDIYTNPFVISNKTYKFISPQIPMLDIGDAVKEILLEKYSLEELVDNQYIYNVETNYPFTRPFKYSDDSKVISKIKGNMKFKGNTIETTIIDYDKIYGEEYDKDFILSNLAVNANIITIIRKKLRQILEEKWQKQLMKLNQISQD